MDVPCGTSCCSATPTTTTYTTEANNLPHHDGTRWLTQTGWANDPP